MKAYLSIYCLLGILVTSNAQYAGSRSMGNVGFLANNGQIHDQNLQPVPNILFLLETEGLNVQIRKTGFSYDFWANSDNANEDLSANSFTKHKNDGLISPLKKCERKFHRIDIEFEGCNSNATVVTGIESGTGYNYYRNTNLIQTKCYNSVTIRDIYAMIDVEFRFNDGENKFEYDFIIHPGANPALIKLRFKGADGLRCAGKGIYVQTRFGEFTESIPRSFIKQNNKDVSVNFCQLEHDCFGFSTPEIDKLSTLVIDPTPTLDWCTYVGGYLSDGLGRVRIDASDNVCVGGGASTPGLATTGTYQTTINGIGDIYIAKFNPSGDLIWATYFGGSGGDGLTQLELNQGGDIWIAGGSSSTDGLASANAFQTEFAGGSSTGDGFIARLTASGQLLWSTYFGAGSDDYINGLAIDSDDNAYIGGQTLSNAGLSTSAVHQVSYGGGTGDGFVAKFNGDGDRLWCSYYGGSAYDKITDVCASNDGNVFLIGMTTSTSGISTSGSNQPNYAGGMYDVFIAKFDGNGSRIWGTYYGGNDVEGANCATIDSNNNIFIVGSTESPNNIATADGDDSMYPGNNFIVDYIAKFSDSGTKIYGSYLQGVSLFDLSVDVNNYVYTIGIFVVGTSLMTSGAWQSEYMGEYDGNFGIFDNDGHIVYGSYFGDTGYDSFGGIDVDSQGNIYISGSTTSTENIATSGAHDETLGGDGDGLIAKFSPFITSVGNLDYSSGINIFPNPSSQFINLVNLPSNESCEISIYNSLGELTLFQEELIDNKYVLDISALPSGLYHIRIKLPNAIYESQVVKL
jgi:hypothetical protein